VGEGEFTNDPLDTFGGAGVVRIPRLQALLRYIHAGKREQARGAALQEKGQQWCNRFQGRILQVIP
jgi:hypothetical protein